VDFRDIRKELDSIIFETLRVDTDTYFEAVIVREHLQSLAQRLAARLGAPLLPPEDRLPQTVQKIIKEYGGIREGQTLYCLSNGGATIVAMLWPWQDGSHTTLKMLQK
jgi:branched-subunit amino acid aminotransferase/4-amino-4-deoxychorismate lyase